MTETRVARTTLTILAATALLATIPAGATAQASGGAASDSATLARLEEMAGRMGAVTGHLKQMSKTLRQNPELEERWTDPAAFDRMIRMSALVEALALQTSALSRELRAGAVGEGASAGTGALAERAAAMRRRVAELLPALEALVEEAAGLTDVAHEGQGGGHAH